MADIDININLNINVNEGGGTADSVTVPAIILYILGFFGMFTMFVNIPTPLLFMGIIAFILYISPLIIFIIGLCMKPFFKKREFSFFDPHIEPITYLMASVLLSGEPIFKSFVKRLIGPFSYFLFNIVLGLFWILYASGSASNVALIGFIIPGMYCMYFYPYVLIKNALNRKSKPLLILSILLIILSFGLFLIFYDKFMAINDVIGFAFFQSCLIVLGTLMILISKVVYLKKKKSSIILLVLYLILALGVGLTSGLLLPQRNAANYEQAKVYIEEGNYKEARELLVKLSNYEDASEIYQSIKFKDLQVGESITFGTQPKKPEEFDDLIDLSWTVISVEDGKALLLSDAIINSVRLYSYSDWENHEVDEYLDNLFEYYFTEEEKERILKHSFTIKKDGVESTYTDDLFILSQAELQQYCSNKQIFSKNDTSFNDYTLLDVQKKDSDYDLLYCFVTRDLDNNGNFLIADCDDKEFSLPNTKYVGIRPAVYITIDE